MFKSKEELKTKGLHTDSSNAYDEGIEDAFKSIAERKDFYLKYKDKPELFSKEVDYCFHKDIEGFVKSRLDFNDWLFHYCFDSVKDD